MNYQGGKIITHGKHGFIVEYNDYNDSELERSIEQAVQYVKKLDQISRDDCHNLFKEKFTAKLMADKHLAFYTRL